MTVIGGTIGQGGDYAKARVTEQITGRKVDTSGWVFRSLLYGGVGLALAMLLMVLWTVLGDGTSWLRTQGLDFITNPVSSRADQFGVFEGLRGTFWIGVFVVLFSFPIGIASAVYLEEYASDNKITRFIELNIRNLAGVPSVVFGVLGLSIFVQFFNGFVPGNRFNGQTTAAAGATLATLVLPIVIITASEAIRAVPDSIREAGFGVGATKSEVVRHHVIPYAAPGILTGTLLSLARALGEAAPLIVIGGVFSGSIGPSTSFLDPEQLGEEFTAMPLLITQLAKKPAGVDGWTEAAAAAIVVLLIAVVAANAVAIVLRNRYEKKRG